MLDRLTDGMFVFDEEWRFRYVNEPAAEMLSHTRDELLGAHAWTLFPEAVGGPSYTAYHEARRDNVPVRVTEYYAPLGRRFEIRAYPIDRDLVVLFRDITDLQRTEDELREFAERMCEAERIAGFGVWRWDLASGSVRWSDELHSIYGLAPGEFGGTVDEFVARLHPEDRDRIWTKIAEALDTLEPFAFEERILWPDGSERLLLSQGRVILGEDGTASALVGVCHDVTERVRTQRALGMSDRRMRAIVDNTPSFIAVKDLDGAYLTANAEAGRILGVDPTEFVGRRCQELFPEDIAAQFRANDHIAAAEGRPVFDETVLLLDGEPRTYSTVTFPLPDEQGRPIEICTIGTDVTERRDRETERRERGQWRERLTSALSDGRMVVHEQPVIDLATGERASCELLVRLREDAGDALLAPVRFLPHAERYGVIQAIDTWVLRQALALARTRSVEVNLSAVTLCDPDARREIVGMLSQDPGAARRVIFEITETAALEHLDAACSFARDIAALGCGLALDDFGTGFGSFTYLRTLPLRYLKIDLSFVSGVVSSVDDRRVVQSIIGIAQQFGLRTIAEGVEDQRTLDALREMGADYAQGFHIGRPAPIDP
jgi:PAS domain S-box-containing protein